MDTFQVNIHEAKIQLSKLIESALQSTTPHSTQDYITPEITYFGILKPGKL